MPENNGAPDARAIPKHKGSATKNTTNPAGRSFFKFLARKYFFRFRLSADIPPLLICIIYYLEKMKFLKTGA
jgi:hypothetical protein